jgi:hypothetical protein
MAVCDDASTAFIAFGGIAVGFNTGSDVSTAVDFNEDINGVTALSVDGVDELLGRCSKR